MILLADDDEEDRMLTEEAFQESRMVNELRTVVDGEEVLDYLHNRGKFKDTTENPLPGLILLDLNMPKKDGREVMAEIRSNPRFQSIPVVAFTTSTAEEDIMIMYNLGVNSYITKPVTFSGMVKAMQSLESYWFEIVSLPTVKNN